MKRFLYFLTFFVFFGIVPGIAEARQTILWIPYHSAAINEVLKILEANESIRITVALDQISPKFEKRIKALEEKGQIEIALRLPNDPVIPLLYYPNSPQVSWEKKPAKSALPDNSPYFMGLRIGTAMDNAKKNLNRRRPKGLVLPPGTMLKDYFPAAKVSGIKWLASGPFYYTGDEEEAETETKATTDDSVQAVSGENTEKASQYEGIEHTSYIYSEDTPSEDGNSDSAESEIITEESSIAEANGVKVIPFSPYSENADNQQEEFLVFDETSEEDPAIMRAAIKEYLGNIQQETITAMEVAETQTAAEITAEEIEQTAQPWTGSYDRWAAKSSQMGTLVAMSQTRNELMKYLNSKAGNMTEAASAFNAYYEAENSRRFLNLGSKEADTAKSSEADMRRALSDVYEIMGKKAPQWAISSLSDAGTGRNTALMRIAMQKTGFEIKNSQDRPVFDTVPQNLPEVADPYKLWKLNSLKVELQNRNVIFRLFPAAINNSGSSLSGFSHIAIDMYIDVNHRVNAGSSAMLPGRPMKMAVEDSWEYALEISPAATYLYRSTSMGPKLVGKYRARVSGGAITVSIPTSILGGTPASWGYAVLMMVPQDGSKYAVADTLGSKRYANTIYAVRPGQGGN